MRSILASLASSFETGSEGGLEPRSDRRARSSSNALMNVTANRSEIALMLRFQLTEGILASSD